MIKQFISFLVTITVLSMGFWVIRLMIESRDAVQWPHTKAQILSSSLIIDHLPKFLDFNADPLRWYGADVRYEYVVNEITYESNKVAIHDSNTRSAASALEVMNKYRKIKEVDAYYNPADPSQAVLEPSNIGDIFLPSMLTVMLMVIWLMTVFNQGPVVNVRRVHDYLKDGNTYQKRGKFQLALNEFNKIVEISPYIAQGYKSRGNLFLEQGHWEDALVDFNQAISIDPTDASLFFSRARAFLGRGQSDKALEDLQKAQDRGLKVDPKILKKASGN